MRQDQRATLYSERLNHSQYHQPLCEGEIACYASHIAVWRRLLRSGASCAAVLEDDIEVGDELPELLSAIADLQGHWDLIKLIGRRVEKVTDSQPLCEGASLVRYQRVPSLTGAYVLHRRGAEKLLAHRMPFGRPVDVDLRYWWECGLNVLGVQPYPVREASSALESSIVGRQLERSPTMRCRKLWLQMQYTWFNWQAQRPGSLPALQKEAPPRVASGGHDCV